MLQTLPEKWVIMKMFERNMRELNVLLGGHFTKHSIWTVQGN
jgi:hypothetical protein